MFSLARSILRWRCISGIMGIGFRGVDGSFGKDCRVFAGALAREAEAHFGNYGNRSQRRGREFREGLPRFHRRARSRSGGAFRELWESLSEAWTGVSGRIVVFSLARSILRWRRISGIMGIGDGGVDGSFGKDCRVFTARSLARRRRISGIMGIGFRGVAGVSGRIAAFPPARSLVRRRRISGIMGIGFRGVAGSFGKDCRVFTGALAREAEAHFGNYGNRLQRHRRDFRERSLRFAAAATAADFREHMISTGFGEKLAKLPSFARRHDWDADCLIGESGPRREARKEGSRFRLPAQSKPRRVGAIQPLGHASGKRAVGRSSGSGKSLHLAAS